MAAREGLVADGECFETADQAASAAVVSDRRALSKSDAKEVESFSVSADEARAKFARGELDTSAQDYSESIAKQKNNKLAGSAHLRAAGFLGTLSEYEVLQRKHARQESPLQKYNRLNAEISQFIADLAEAEKEKPGSAIEQGLSAGEIANELQRLQGVLHSAAQRLGPGGAAAKGSSVVESLRAATQAVKENKDAGSGGGAADADRISYELYYDGAGAGEGAAASADLERRVASLERRVLAPDAPSESSVGLERQVCELERRVGLLNAAALSRLQGHVTSIAVEGAKTEQLLDRQKELQVNKLYEMMTRWDKVMSAVPGVVQRLHALQGVHTAAASFVADLNRVAQQQLTITAQLKEGSEQLAKVQEGFTENLKAIETNIASLSERMAKLEASG